MSKELYEAERYLIGSSLGSKTATVVEGKQLGTYDVTVTTSRPNGKIVGLYHGISGHDVNSMDIRMSSKLRPEIAARLALVPVVPTAIWTANRVGDLGRGVRNLVRRTTSSPR